MALFALGEVAPDELLVLAAKEQARAPREAFFPPRARMLAAPGAAAKQDEVKHGPPPQRALDTVLVIRVARLEVPFTHPRDGGRPEPVKPPREVAWRRAPGRSEGGLD